MIDRGGDARVLLEDRLDHDYRFVARLRGDRTLLRFDSAWGGLADTVETFAHGQWVGTEAGCWPRRPPRRTAHGPRLAENGAAVVFCGRNPPPAAMAFP